MATKTILDVMEMEQTRDYILAASYQNLRERIGQDKAKQKKFIALVREAGKVIGDYFIAHDVSWGDGLVILDSLLGVHTKQASREASALAKTMRETATV